MASGIFNTEKVLFGVLTFVVAMFFELHVAIWWVSRSDSLGDLRLLLAMGLITVAVFFILTWYILKTIIMYQVGKRTVRERTSDTESEAESSSRLGWWKKVILGYIVVMVGLGTVALLLSGF